MFNLGRWTPHINQRETLSWYDLPKSTAYEFGSYRADGSELEPIANYDKLHAAFVGYVRRSVGGTRPAYHNDHMHFEQAEIDGLKVLDALEHYRPGSVPLVVRQVAGLSFRGHDAFHCGATFRIQAPNQARLPWPNLGHRVSSEWVTAHANDQLLKRAGLVAPARFYQISIAWSSTYGGNTPLGRQLNFPQPRPTSVAGATMRAADVCTPTDPHHWLRQAVAVNYLEVPATPPAQTWAEFIAKERAFAGYILFTLDELDAAVGFDLAEAIGWRRRLAERIGWIDQLNDRRSPLRKFATNELQRAGVTLG